MITNSMVKAVILNTLAISRQRGEQSYLPLPSITTCHQAPSLFLILHLSVSIHFLMSIFCFYPFSISNHSQIQLVGVFTMIWRSEMRLKFASASHKPGYAEYLKCEAILLGPTERTNKHFNSWYLFVDQLFNFSQGRDTFPPLV